MTIITKDDRPHELHLPPRVDILNMSAGALARISTPYRGNARTVSYREPVSLPMSYDKHYKETVARVTGPLIDLSASPLCMYVTTAQGLDDEFYLVLLDGRPLWFSNQNVQLKAIT